MTFRAHSFRRHSVRVKTLKLNAFSICPTAFSLCTFLHTDLISDVVFTDLISDVVFTDLISDVVFADLINDVVFTDSNSSLKTTSKFGVFVFT